jgi:flavin-dependent thymidylate synthase
MPQGGTQSKNHMKIILAGYNIDADLIRMLKEKGRFTQDLTPETISAAYARISRSPKPVFELRRDARAEVDKARKSNRNIVFEMGHSSIAEHAVFNIDVIGVSRLLVEEIEKFRLCSFTEKSQRYVLFDKDFVIPAEIAETGLTDLFVSTITMQNDFYHQLYEQLRPFVFEHNKALAENFANKSMLEGWAKEDARYAISLSTETQLGMTINARNLELMLRRLAALPIEEAQEFSQKLYAVTKDITPSLIRYIEATDYDQLTRFNLRKQAGVLSVKYPQNTPVKKIPLVQLSFVTPDADTRIAALLLFSSSSLNYRQCLNQAAGLNPREKKALFKIIFGHLKAHDAVLRELEAVDLQFDLMVSASCFAQLKRHRMSTIIAQDYDPHLGITIPPSIKTIGQQKVFEEIVERTNEVYEQIKKKAPLAASYILTNAHRRRVVMKLNARELYHLARLRGDTHAQWDIRMLTQEMLRKAKKAMPLTLMMACGKDSFTSLHEKAFPRV